MSVSTPNTKITLAQSELIVRGLYRGFLGREPDAAGLRHWAEAHLSSGDANAVLKAIIGSPEYQNRGARQSARSPLAQALTAQARGRLATRPLTVVDVGAQELEDEQHVYAPLCRDGLPHRIIGFEPLEDKFNARRTKRPDGSTELFQTFIGDGGQHVFHINNFDATSSLLPLNTSLTTQLSDLSYLATIKTEVVNTSTLDTVLNESAPHVDFLKLDIQGFELAALEHGKAVLSRTNVVHSEVSFMPIYEGQALFSDVEPLLRAEGFYLLDFSSTCHYPYHTPSNSPSRDRLGWADAVFFKSPELLATPDDLLAQCVIALLVYDKFSLAESLALRYDQATGRGLASLFLDH